ncbi:MAG: hypothetical protein ACYCO9_09715 [Streptosporangiaceae bacterium]
MKVMVESQPTRDKHEPHHRLSEQQLGSLIGAVFALIYVEANSGALPPPAPASLRVAAAVAFAGLISLLVNAQRHPRLPAEQGGSGGFGRGYWLVVAAEAAAMVAGSAIISRALDAPHAVVAWVSVVVGFHFVALGVTWRLRMFHLFGAAIALCGVAGLASAAIGVGTAVIATLGGVLPGVLLFVFAYWGAIDSRRRPGRTTPGSPNLDA